MSIQGTVIDSFEHHATIRLPGGVKFQVARSALEKRENGYALREDAQIEHVFPRTAHEERFPTVSVPPEVLRRIADTLPSEREVS